MIEWILFWVRFPRRFEEFERKQNQVNEKTLALLKKIDDATTAIGQRIQKLIDASDDTALNAALQAEVDKLTALGADPADPVPVGTVTALDGMKDKTVDPSSDDNGVQETTPILDKQ